MAGEFKQGDVVRTTGHPSFEFVVREDKLDDQGRVSLERIFQSPDGSLMVQGFFVDPFRLLHVPTACDPCECGEPDCPMYACENGDFGDDECDNEAVMMTTDDLFFELSERLRDDGLAGVAADIDAVKARYEALTGDCDDE